MKKINLKGISEILSEKELKNVMGGSGGSGDCPVGTTKCSCNGTPLGCKTPSDCCEACGVKC